MRSPNPLEHAEAVARVWSADTFRRYAEALRAAMADDDAQALDAVRHSAGLFCLSAALAETALIAFHEASVAARDRRDGAAADRAVQGQYFALVILNEVAAAAAAKALLGDGAWLPDPRDLIPDQAEGGADQAPPDAEACRAALAEAVGRYSGRADLGLLGALDALAGEVGEDPQALVAPVHLLNRDIRDHLEARLAHRRGLHRRSVARRALRRYRRGVAAGAILGSALLVLGLGPTGNAAAAGSLLLSAAWGAGWAVSHRRIGNADHMIMLAMNVLRITLGESTHWQAQHFVLDALGSHSLGGFALLLRSFAREARTTTWDMGEAEEFMPTTAQRMTSLPSPADLLVEKWVVDGVGAALPVVAITSPDLNLLYATGLTAPRLEATGANWEATVAFLAHAAEMIVVDCVELTPGLQFEFGLLRVMGKQQRTVAVLPSAETRAHLDNGRRLYKDTAPYTSRAELAAIGFERIIAEEDLLAAAAPADLTVFARLLPDHPRPAAAPVTSSVDDDLRNLATARIAERSVDGGERALEILSYLLKDDEKELDLGGRMWLLYHIGIAYRMLARDHDMPYAQHAVVALTQAVLASRQIAEPTHPGMARSALLALAEALALPGVRTATLADTTTGLLAALELAPLVDDVEARVQVRSSLAAAHLVRAPLNQMGSRQAAVAGEILEAAMAELLAHGDAVSAPTTFLVMVNLATARVLGARDQTELAAARAEAAQIDEALGGYTAEVAAELSQYGTTVHYSQR